MPTSRTAERAMVVPIFFTADLLRVGGQPTTAEGRSRLPRSPQPGRPPTTLDVSPAAIRSPLRGLLLVQRFLVDLEDGLVLRLDREGNHARDQPFGPHLVDLGLEVLHVLVGEVREPALALEVLEHRLALLAALGDLPGRTGQIADAVDDLVERPDPALDREMAELLRILRVVVPALGARVEGVNEGGSTELECL